MRQLTTVLIIASIVLTGFAVAASAPGFARIGIAEYQDQINSEAMTDKASICPWCEEEEEKERVCCPIHGCDCPFDPYNIEQLPKQNFTPWQRPERTFSIDEDFIIGQLARYQITPRPYTPPQSRLEDFLSRLGQ